MSLKNLVTPPGIDPGIVRTYGIIMNRNKKESNKAKYFTLLILGFV
jgi:hypothetical protein